MIHFDEFLRNRRLRVGAAVILAMLSLYGLLEWRDHQQASVSEYKQLAGQIARLQNREVQALWPARADEAEKALTTAQSWLWQNSSYGLAQAEFQDWLYAQLRQVDAKNFQVKFTDPASTVAGEPDTRSLPTQLKELKQLRVRVEFNSDTNVLLGLLAALGQAPHGVVVDALTVKAQRVELGLTAWFLMRPVAAAATGSQSNL